MNAKQQAQSQVESIVEMIRAVDCDFDRLEELREEKSYCEDDGLAFEWSEELAGLEEQAGEYADQDEAWDAIYGTPLSIEVRSGWRSVGEDAGEPEEFRIVLCTGGPHVELTGDIGGTVRVVFKDWGESGEYYPGADERSALGTFVGMLITGH